MAVSTEGPRPDHGPADWTAGAIAVIGMAGRFPGASTVDDLWRNIRNGVESLGQVTDEELLAAGIDPKLINDPNYVKVRPYLDDVAGFDASFFGYSPREAKMADPQQRAFLECAWEALEHGGYGNPDRRGRVGVFGGANISMYAVEYLGWKYGRFDFNPLEVVIGNDKDALCTMVSYKLNLTGPSIAVQTFCSSSLSAVHLACLSLRHGECDMAIAGGVCIRIPDRIGYLYTEGGMESPDGHVRTFDADARGGNFGDGAAVVLLKPLRKAVADRDTVFGVIRGSAMTNDGALRFSYTAPSVVGQAQAVADAMADAGVTPAQMSYVEAHGTATELGDPIEVAALTRAYGPLEQTQYCGIGSVKTNVGHLDRAAGTTGLIKIVQSLRHEMIPATLHYRSPNPEIDFDNSPFYVVAQPTPWPRQADRPRIAGLNSLGMGGTNVHVVVQEAPLPARRPTTARRWHILPVSARSETAVTEYGERLGDHLRAAGGSDLADVAFTLQVGRQVFEHRRVAVVDSLVSAAAVFDPANPQRSRLLARADATNGRGVAFLIAGVGEHYQGMVASLYEQEPVFRDHLDECRAILSEYQSVDVVDALVRRGESGRGAAADLAHLMGRQGGDGDTPLVNRTEIAQPAAFAAYYALARTLMAWGVSPSVLIGYSVGEYVAACLSGVLSLRDALRLVARRAEMIATLPTGAMLAVGLAEADLRSRVPDLHERGLDVAALNGAQLVVAGTVAAVQSLAADLRPQGVACRELATTHAFHSRLLEPVAAELTAWVSANVTLHPPTIRYISNVTGTAATAELVTDASYWARHMCQTVRFNDGLAAMLSVPGLSIVEIGPGKSLGAVARSHPSCGIQRWPLIVPTLPAAAEDSSDDATVAEALGRLWLAGVAVDWHAYQGVNRTPGSGEDRFVPGRVPLPTYPFQRQRFWWTDGKVAPVGQLAAENRAGGGSQDLDPLPRLPEHRFIHLPVWRQTAPRPAAADSGSGPWLVYTDAGAAETLTGALATRLRAAGHDVTFVRPGNAFAATPGDSPVAAATYRIRPGNAEDTLALFGELREHDRLPHRVVHLWTLGNGEAEPPVADVIRLGLHSIVALARAAQESGLSTWTLDIVTAGTQSLSERERVYPERTSVIGPCRMIPVESPGARTRLIDLPADAALPVSDILAELWAEPVDQVVALREHRRWIPGYDVLETRAGHQPMTDPDAPIRPGGVYLITGGLGGIGLAMAERLAEHYGARLVLFGRTPVPPREAWDEVLSDRGATEEVRRRLEILRRLEVKGTEFELVSGDAADLADVRRAVDTALHRFGELNGVLHAAGVPGVGLMVLKTNADMDRVLAPKVAGTIALTTALRDVPIDFLALFSSVGSATGAVGQTDYCSANAFMDAYVHSGTRSVGRVVSIGWGEWTWNGWTAGLAGYEPAVREYLQEHRRVFGLTFDEGWRAFLRVLATGQSHVFVSTQDFTAVVAGSRTFTVADLKAAARSERDGADRHPRPDLSTQYEAPQTSAERAIAEIWAEALGLERVGTHDNFFELGGNSLIGVSIVDTVRRALELSHLPAHIIYQAPTVGALALAASGEQRPTAEPSRRALAQRARSQRRRNSLSAGRSE